jgi:hypothetical protein
MKKNVRIDCIDGPTEKTARIDLAFYPRPKWEQAELKMRQHHTGKAATTSLNFVPAHKIVLLQNVIHRPFVLNINEYSRKTTHASLKCGCSVT